MMIAEVYMDHLARVAGIPLAELQARNFYAEGAPTHFGQPLEGSQVGVPCHTPSDLPRHTCTPCHAPDACIICLPCSHS